MKQLTSALRRVADDLERAGARFAVVGGLAVSARTIPRFTRDVDLAVAVQTDREGIEPEIVAAAEPLEIADGVIAPVARSGHLVAMKVLSFDANRRPQDGVDLSMMLRDATSEDLALARSSLELMNERGCGHTKDLLAAFDEALARADRSG